MSEAKRVTLYGHQVTYREVGEEGAEAIVLVHGMAGSSRTWELVMPALAPRYRVVAPDLLGHGQADIPTGDYSLGAYANAVRDLMAHLEIKRATIVGHSLGGGIALQIAYQHPDLCKRLVLVSSGGLGREVSPLLRLLSLPGSELVLTAVTSSFVRDRGETMNRLLWGRGIRSPLWAEMWRAYASLADAENRQAFVRTLRSVIDLGGQAVNANDRLYLAAAVPTLIIWGDHDEIIPVSHAYHAHHAIPGSRLEVFEGVWHFPQSEDPDHFAEVLLDFMATTTPGQVGTSTLHDLLVEDPEPRS